MRLRKHPRNRNFAWRNHTPALRRLTEAEATQYDLQGFVVLADVFPPDLVDAIAAEIDPIEARVETYLQQQPKRRSFIARAGEITFSPHLVERSQRLVEFVRHPAFAEIAHDLVGPDVRLHWDQSVYKKPGARAPFPWHQDNGYTYVEPQQYLTCWVALTDATPDNGCPWVLPGLHRRGTFRHRRTELGFVCVEEPETKPIAAPVRKGGIVVFSSLTPHSTGPNRSSEVRKAYIVQFAPDGATVFPADPLDDEEPTSGVSADAPKRQFRILHDGVRVNVD